MLKLSVHIVPLIPHELLKKLTIFAKCPAGTCKETSGFPKEILYGNPSLVSYVATPDCFKLYCIASAVCLLQLMRIANSHLCRGLPLPTCGSLNLVSIGYRLHRQSVPAGQDTGEKVAYILTFCLKYFLVFWEATCPTKWFPKYLILDRLGDRIRRML